MQLEHRSAGQHALTERLAQPGQEHAQGGLGRRGPLLWPQDLEQVLAADRAVSVHHEIGKKRTALPPGQITLQLPSLEDDGERTG